MRIFVIFRRAAPRASHVRTKDRRRRAEDLGKSCRIILTVYGSGPSKGAVMLKKLLIPGLALSALTLVPSRAEAGVTISPYVSIKSTKSLKPVTKDKSKETDTVQQRQEAGLRGSLSFFRLFGLSLSVGQSKLTTTQKVQDAKDEYGEIDYAKDLNMSTDAPDNDVKITETQRNARLNVSINPSFWIFILKAQIGVTATQRIITTEEAGKDGLTKTFGPTYKPNSGFGFGVRFTPSMYAMAEYNMYHYAFPKLEPFEREVALSYSVEL